MIRVTAEYEMSHATPLPSAAQEVSKMFADGGFGFDPQFVRPAARSKYL
jgi:hypothetical protein